MRNHRARTMAELRMMASEANVGDVQILAASGALAVSAIVQDIHPQGGTLIQPSAAGALTALSDSNDDSLAGPGVGIIAVLTLDSDYGNDGADINQPWSVQFLTLIDNATPATVPGTWLRALTAFAVVPGATAPPRGSNVGTISLKLGGLEVLTIQPQTGFAASTWTCIPKDWEGKTDGFHISWAGSSPVKIRCEAQPVFGAPLTAASVDVAQSIDYPFSPITFPERTTVVCTGVRAGGPLEDVGITNTIPIYRIR